MILAAAVLCAVVSVHDGDSLRCNGEKIRIVNIDAPELPGSPRCDGRRAAPAWCDYAAGAAARDALRQFVARGRVTIERQGTDVYGRTLARVAVNGLDAGEWLIQRGLARAWR